MITVLRKRRRVLAAAKKTKPKWHTYFPQPLESKRNITLAARLFGLPLSVVRDILIGDQFRTAIHAERLLVQKKIADTVRRSKDERSESEKRYLALDLQILEQHMRELVDNPEGQLMGDVCVFAFTKNELRLKQLENSLALARPILRDLEMGDLLEGGPILLFDTSYPVFDKMANGSYVPRGDLSVRLPDVISLGMGAFDAAITDAGENWPLSYTLIHELGHRFMWCRMTNDQYRECGYILSVSEELWRAAQIKWPHDPIERIAAMFEATTLYTKFTNGEVPRFKGPAFKSPTTYGQQNYSEAFAEWFTYHVFKSIGSRLASPGNRSLVKFSKLRQWETMADPQVYKKLCAALGWKPANV